MRKHFLFQFLKGLMIFALLLCFTGITWAQTISDGLVAYYPFNGNANDETGNGSNGTTYGATLTEDRCGNPESAFHFDGVDDFIDLGNPAILNIHEAITISAWARVEDATSTNCIISKWKYVIHNQGSWRLLPYTFSVIGANGYSAAHAGYDYLQQSSDYKHYVGIYSQQDNLIKYYENGNLIAVTEGRLGSIFISNSNVLIGAAIYFDPIYFKGDIDDIRIYNRALTQEEITELYYSESTCTSQTGLISGTVSVNGNGLENVLVKLLDEFGLPVDGFDDVYTDTNGAYSFCDAPLASYQVMIVEPLGYVSDGNPKTTIVTANETSTINFNLTEILVVNQSRSKGYWKHQFDVYVKEKGNAHESAEDLTTFISEVHNRYDPRFNIFFNETSFEDWQNVMSVKGNAGMEAKAKSHIAALALNIMSQKIAQYEIVTEDNYTAADVLTYTSELLLDSNPENDELAKDLAELVNEQQTIPTGQVNPSQNILYKHQGLSSDPGVPTQFNLHQNYPNPFNPSTTITFDIPKDTFVSLKVYDISGRVINQLVKSFLNEGHYNIEFNGSDLSSGIYYYELTAGDFRSVKKLVLTK